MTIALLMRAVHNRSFTLSERAIAYAEAGFAVFPLLERGKTPLLSHRRGGKGFRDASTDAAQVAAWWKRFPNANIGCVPGKSGLIVIDIDGPDGERTWAKLGLSTLETLSVVTGRKEGGRHLYFLHPGDKIGNRPLGDKVDIRADAGYVILPPSIHPTGAIYTWVNPRRKPIQLPNKLLKGLRSQIVCVL